MNKIVFSNNNFIYKISVLFTFGFANVAWACLFLFKFPYIEIGLVHVQYFIKSFTHSFGPSLAERNQATLA